MWQHSWDCGQGYEWSWPRDSEWARRGMFTSLWLPFLCHQDIPLFWLQFFYGDFLCIVLLHTDWGWDLYGSSYLSWLSSFQIPLTCAELHTLTHGLERLSFPPQISSFMNHSLYLCVEMMVPSRSCQGTTKNNSVELRGAPVVEEPMENWGTSSAFFPVTPMGLQSISLTWPCAPSWWGNVSRQHFLSLEIHFWARNLQCCVWKGLFSHFHIPSCRFVFPSEYVLGCDWTQQRAIVRGDSAILRTRNSLK